MELQIIDVAAVLAEQQVKPPSLTFLSSAPGYIRVLMLQPRAVISADPAGVCVTNPPELERKVDKFLQEADARRVDLALAPEYCCPWECVARAVEAGTLPSAGRLWAIGCQSLTKAGFEHFKDRLKDLAIFVIENSVFDEAGDFVDPLTYIFRSTLEDGSPAVVILIQPKTHPMGGGEHFEYTHLQTGSRLYRFVGPGQRANSLVGLVCSDVLHPQFADNVPNLHHETLILHAQLNPDSSPPPYRAYRESCCTIAPRTAEILTLNWALGTQIASAEGPKPLIDEPRSMLLRPAQELDTSEETFLANHMKGLYLTNWRKYRTAAFIFSPDEYLHFFETTKPSLVGPPTNTLRTGPRALALFEWKNETQTWAEKCDSADDRFNSYWLNNYQELHEILEPLAQQPSKVERLISLSIGMALTEDWDHWNKLEAYELADDETACRFTVCWSEQGRGYTFRANSLARFRGFAEVVNAPSNFSSRLAEFKAVPFSIAYRDDTAAQRFQNLHIDGQVSATAIYLGQTPPVEVVQRVITETTRQLRYHGADVEKMAVWSLEPSGLRDHMDAFVPSITSDPAADPADIALVEPA